MEEVDQVTALRTKLFFYLIGYPMGAITHAMNGRTGAKSGLHSTVKRVRFKVMWSYSLPIQP